MKYVAKIIPWIIISALAIFTIISLKECISIKNKVSVYERQVQGLLTEKEHLIQNFNKELGLSQSKLVSKNELIHILEKEKENISNKFQSFIDENNLQIQSRDRTIFSLRQKVSNGNTIVVYDKCKSINEHCTISYSWGDKYDRFSLHDPNIFTESDEIFTSNQLFKIYGLILQQDDGSLQTRQLSLKEVYKKQNGEYVNVPGAESEIVSSEFVYDNKPITEDSFVWTDIFTLRPIFVSSLKLLPDTGMLEYGIGLEVLGYYGFGLNSHVSFNFADPEQIGLYLGLAYAPTFFKKPFNFGVSVSIGTPFYTFGQTFSFKAGLVFYLW